MQADLHPAPAGHPESPERLRFALDYLYKSDQAKLIERIEPSTNIDYETVLYQVHEEEYINRIKKASEKSIPFDSDTYLSPGSYTAAIAMTKASIEAVDFLFQDQFEKIIIAGRPPGHHAEYNRAMGFCLINNSAIAAQAAIEKYNLNRVAIIDWDVHHGNGTQHIFYNRKDVFYISLHQYPFYPGTGTSSETGEGEGEGFTLNYPLPYGSGDDKYLEIFYNDLLNRLDKYNPQFIIIICGFDAHRDDILGGMKLSEEAFGLMSALVAEKAEKYCDGKIISFIEGGYSPEANGKSLCQHIKGLKGIL